MTININKLIIATAVAMISSTEFVYIAMSQENIPYYERPLPKIQCAKRLDMVSSLSNKWGEVRVGSGLLDAGGLNEGGAIVSLYANPTTGTWTFIQSIKTPEGKESGVKCVLAHGVWWAPGEYKFDKQR